MQFSPSKGKMCAAKITKLNCWHPPVLQTWTFPLALPSELKPWVWSLSIILEKGDRKQWHCFPQTAELKSFFDNPCDCTIKGSLQWIWTMKGQWPTSLNVRWEWGKKETRAATLKLHPFTKLQRTLIFPSI